MKKASLRCRVGGVGGKDDHWPLANSSHKPMLSKMNSFAETSYP